MQRRSLLIVGIFLLLWSSPMILYCFGNIDLEIFIKLFINNSDYSKIIKRVGNEKLYLFTLLIYSFIGLVSTLIYLFFKLIIRAVRHLTKDFSRNIKYLFEAAKYPSFIIIILIPLSISIICAAYIPILYDEAFTYLNFTKKGVLFSLFYYPAPNNHVLFSISTNLFYWLRPLFPVLSIRLPSLIFHFLFLLTSFAFVRKYWDKNMAVLCTGLTSVLLMNLASAFTARGYELTLLIFIIGLHFTFKILKDSVSFTPWFWLSLFSALGILTIPSFVYAYLTLQVFLFSLLKFPIILKRQIPMGLATGLLSLIFYLPIILTNGLDSLLNNETVSPISRFEVIKGLIPFFIKSGEFILGVPIEAFGIPLIISVLILLILKNRLGIHLTFTFLLMPPILLIIHSVIPFERTFYHYGFMLILIILMGINPLLNFKKWDLKMAVGITLAFQILFSIRFYLNAENLYNIYFDAKRHLEATISKNQNYLIYSPIYDVYLLYYLDEKGENDFNLIFKNNQAINVDTISNIDVAFVDPKFDETKVLKPTFSNYEINIYDLRPHLGQTFLINPFSSTANWHLHNSKTDSPNPEHVDIPSSTLLQSTRPPT